MVSITSGNKAIKKVVKKTTQKQVSVSSFKPEDIVVPKANVLACKNKGGQLSSRLNLSPEEMKKGVRVLEIQNEQLIIQHPDKNASKRRIAVHHKFFEHAVTTA